MKQLLIVFFCLLLSGCIKEDPSGCRLIVGDGLPDFEVEMNDGSIISSDSLKGSVSVIMFFHTSCYDCQQTLPVMQRVYDEYSSKGIIFLLISRAQSQEDVESYFEQNALNMPFAGQENRTVYDKFAQSGIPRIYVNDINGIIQCQFKDSPIPTYEELCSAIEVILQKR
jgi:peroxiredoxin